MQLRKLLTGFEYNVQNEKQELEVTGVFYDSRRVIENSAFVCITGVNSDGHDYVKSAVEKGAKVIVAQHAVEVPENVMLVITQDTRKALAFMSAAWFNHPAAKLKTVGITGTKGKTTTAYMVYSILKEAGCKCGLIGTIETIIGDEHIHAANTTPESYVLQEYLARMVSEGCEYVVMEVSSQGLKQSRVEGITYDIGVFTNLEPDHIAPGEHESFEEYLECKAMLFKRCRTGIFNIDDSHAAEIMKGHTCSAETFGLSEKADLRAENIDLHSSMGSLGVKYKLAGALGFDVYVSVPGKFSIYNSLAAIAICSRLNIPGEFICSALSHFSVKGRVEPIKISERFTLLIDYAHNAMALKSLLTTMRDYNPKRLVCLFGCGGNRAKDRRYEMGEVSSRLADLTIVTSDNPRFEKPEDIIADIITGVKKADGEYVQITDRKEAIRYAIKNACDGDVIILAGKGHEDYQEICGKKYPMDERELIAQVIEEMTPQERSAL